VLTELINWGRECSSNRCSHLFGLKKDQYRLSCHRLQLQVHLWYDSPLPEVLITQSSFPDRAHIIHCHNKGIAIWLDQQHAIRETALALSNRPTGQLSIIHFRGTSESHRHNNASFQTRLQDARQANLSTRTETLNSNDGDHSTGGHSPAEEPLD